MIKARVIPKSWLKTYHTWTGYTSGNRSSGYLWREGYRPEVETMEASNDPTVRLWRLQSSPDGVGGHQIDLFIDREDLLDEAVKAHGGLPELMKELGARASHKRYELKQAGKVVAQQAQRIEELEAKVAEYAKRRAAGI